MRILEINSVRDYYTAGEASQNAMTVQELIDLLEEVVDKENTYVVTSQDGHYTFGYVDEDRISIINK